jgi:VanZ family protein
MNRLGQLGYRFFAWLLALFYMAGIFYLSHQPTVPLPERFPHQDKVFHFLAYWILGFLLAHAASRGGTKRRFWFAFSCAALYGVSDEIHQYFVPGRDASVGDWVADAIGAWFGAYLYLKSEGVFRRNRAK